MESDGIRELLPACGKSGSYTEKEWGHANVGYTQYIRPDRTDCGENVLRTTERSYLHAVQQHLPEPTRSKLWHQRGYPEKLGAKLHRYANDAVLVCRKHALAAFEAIARRMRLVYRDEPFLYPRACDHG
jgi:hypothetical protein